MIQSAVEQFLPAIAAGTLLTVVLLRFAPHSLWMLARTVAGNVQPGRLCVVPLPAEADVSRRRLVSQRGVDLPRGRQRPVGAVAVGDGNSVRRRPIARRRRAAIRLPRIRCANLAAGRRADRRFAYDGIDRVIHERARLGVLSSLLAHSKGLPFGEAEAAVRPDRWQFEPPSTGAVERQAGGDLRKETRTATGRRRSAGSRPSAASVTRNTCAFSSKSYWMPPTPCKIYLRNTACPTCRATSDDNDCRAAGRRAGMEEAVLTSIKSRFSWRRAASVCALLALASPGAQAGGGPLGIDHEWALDQSGIWARSIPDGARIRRRSPPKRRGALWFGNDNEIGHTFWQSADASIVSGLGALALKVRRSAARVPTRATIRTSGFKAAAARASRAARSRCRRASSRRSSSTTRSEHPWVWSLEALPIYDGIARMKSQAHWQTDVIAGWVLGTAVGYWSTTRQRR